MTPDSPRPPVPSNRGRTRSLIRGALHETGISTALLRRSLYGFVFLYFAGCFIALPYLPERTPLHFDFSGRVTSWMPSSPVLWFMLPALALGIIALALAASGPPEAWNLRSEDVKRVRSLPADVQQHIRESVERTLLVTFMSILPAFVSLQVGIFATAIDQSDRMPGYATGGMFISIAAAVVVGIRGQRRLVSKIRSAAAHSHERSARPDRPPSGMEITR